MYSRALVSTSCWGGFSRIASFLASLALLFSLAACGGGEDPQPAPSSPATAPVITSHPADQNIVAGAPASFSVLATGTAPLVYQWQTSEDGSSYAPIAGATSPQYRIDSSSEAQNEWRFRVVVSNSAGSVASNAARLTVISAPVISAQPAAQIVDIGSPASFSVVALGTSPLAYRWQASVDGTHYADIAGATSDTYVVAAATPAQNGSSFRVVISNAAGSVTSAAARLTVSMPTAGLACTGPDSTGWCKAREPTLGPNVRLSAVARLSSSTVIAVGAAGAILRSTDAGQTWTRIESGETLDLTAVSFADARNGLVAGIGDLVLRTTDGGLTWAREERPFFYPTLWFDIRGIAAPAAEAGVTVSGLGLIGRANAKDLWFQASVGPIGSAANRFMGVAFTNATDGLAVGWAIRSYGEEMGAIAFRTTDGGRSWSGSVVASSGRLNAVAFADTSTAVAVGSIPTGGPGESSQALLRSIDGGASWQRAPSVNNVEPLAVAFAGPDTVVAVGAEGSFLRSADAGLTWITARGDTGNKLNGIAFLDGEVGVAVGDAGTIVRTTDGGRNWVTAVSARYPDLKSAAFGLDGAIAAGSYGNLLFSVDGSRWSWAGSSYRGHLSGVALEENGRGYALSSLSPSGSELLSSSDAGRTWSTAARRNERLSVISMRAAGSGVVAGSFGATPAILRFSNADPSQLSPATLPTLQPVCSSNEILPASCATPQINALAFADAAIGVAVGDYGLFLSTGDGGASWNVIDQPTMEKPALFGASFATTSVGVAVGVRGLILRTTDGGKTWAQISSGTSESLRAVAFATADVGFAVGDRGTILRTANGGASWTKITSGTSVQLNGVAFRNAAQGIIVGNGGVILVTASGGL